MDETIEYEYRNRIETHSVDALDVNSTKWANLARVDAQGQKALCYVERLASYKSKTGQMSAFEYLYIAESWSSRDFQEVIAYVGGSR